MESWKDFLGRLKNPTSEVKIGLVGKYVELPDAYKSIIEAFIHAGAKNECKVRVEYIHSEGIYPDNAKEKLGHLDGVLVAPDLEAVVLKVKLMPLNMLEKIIFHSLVFVWVCNVQ